MALALIENDFDFYLRFAKPLVLNLSEPNDRALAAAWIQKLRNEDVGDERLRTDYLKLLLFVLQRNKLIGTFATNPNTFQKLNEFPETQLKDIAKELLESEKEIRKKKPKEGGDNPPYATEHSGDLLEYAAAQEIPNFGVHAYYAISNDPLSFWDNTERAIFPRGAVSATDQSVCPSPAPHVGESSSEPTLQQRKVQFSSPGTPRQTPLRAAPRLELSEEERVPLTWGSNLIGVSEPTPHEYQPLVDDDVSDVFVTPDTETEITEDFRPVCSDEPPFSGNQDAVGPDDFAPFDTMLEEYNKDEKICTPSTTPASSGATRSGLPVCETGVRKSSLRKPGESKTSKPGTVMCSTKTDVFQIEPRITSPYLSLIHQTEPDPFFFGEGAHIVQDYKAPVLESIEDLPLSPPKRGLFSPNAREEQEDIFFLNSPPSFLDNSPISEDSEEPLRAQSPRKLPINVADYSLQNLPYSTSSPQRYNDYSLPLRISSPSKHQKPCGTPVYKEEMTLPLQTSSYLPSPEQLADNRLSPTLKNQETPRLVPERDQIGYSLTPPGFRDFAITPVQKHDIFNSSQGDVSLPLENMSPKLSTVTQKLFSSVFAEEDEFHLEDQPSFFDISEVGSGDEVNEQITSPSHEGKLQPNLLQALGLTSDQMQTETHKPVEREYNPPIVTAIAPTEKDIIDDFNKRNREHAFTPRPKPRIALPKAGIPRPIPPSGSNAVQIQQQPHALASQAFQRQPRRPLPGHSGIARPINKLVSKSFSYEQSLERPPFSPKITLEESKVFQAAAVSLQRRVPEQFSRVSPIQAMSSPAENSRMLPMQEELFPRKSPERPLRKSPEETVTCSGKSPCHDTRLDQTFQPSTPSSRRVEMESSFQIEANESFTPLGFESPPKEYHSPEFIVSPEDKFGLPKRLEIELLPSVVFRSSPQESPIAPTIAQETIQSTFPATKRVFETVRLPASDYPPATTREVENPQNTPTGGISELTTESLPGKVSLQVENILKKLEDSFETQWTFAELSKHHSNVFEDSFPLIASPNEESSVTEFNFPTIDQIQADINNILAQTPNLPSSLCRSLKKESPFFEKLENREFTQIDNEILPEEAYQSPKTPPGYQSPTKFFKQPLPADSYQPLEYFDSPELVSPEVYRSPTKRPADGISAASYSSRSPIKSPQNLKNRLLQTEYLPYGERDRVAVRPKVPTVRELPDYYHEEDVPFLQRVESAQRKWKKKQKRLKIPKASLDNVFESPVTIPTMFEVEDMTGLRNEIEEYERKYPNLADTQKSRPSRRPEYEVKELSEFWDTPPGYKFNSKTPELVRICSPLSPCLPDQYIDEEHLPESAHSPDILSAEELQLFNVTKGISKAMEESIFQLHRPEHSPVQYYVEEDTDYNQSHPLTTMTQLKEMGKRNPADITEEQLPIYLVQSPPPSPEIKTPPRRTPLRPVVSPSSPLIQYSTPLRPQTSQFSPPESPTAFRRRVYTKGKPAYLSKPQMHVLSGKTRAKKIPVIKQLPTPKIETVIEETEEYDEEYVPFRTEVKLSQKKFPKKRKRIRMATSPMEDIRESPVKIPFYTEVYDPTGAMGERKEVQKRLNNLLPQVEQEYPEHMFGISTSVPCGRLPKSVLDTTPPRDLPVPMRPEAKICGWKSPPEYELTPLHSSRPYRVLSPEEPETLEREIIPTDIIFSPPHLSPTLTPLEQRTQSPITPNFRDLNIPSPPPGGVIIETIEIVEDPILDDEIFPDELAVLNSTQSTIPLRQFSPLSPPESPVDLHIRIHNAPEPQYLSKPYTDVLVGSKKVRVKKRSSAPKVSKIRETLEDVPEEHIPFLSQVECARKMTPTKRTRVQRSPKLEPLKESPVDVPNWMELDDDKTGFKKIREEIESRYAYLPQMTQEYPQEMFDSTVAGKWNQQYTELDTNLPQTLPMPLQPTSKVEDWKTPPQYRQSPKQGVKSDGFQFQYVSDLEGDLQFEGLPTEFRFTSPMQSPTSEFSSQGTTPVRRSPKSPVDYFEQLQKRIGTEPKFLDSEIIVEDEEVFDLPSFKTPSPFRKITAPCQKAKRSRLTEGNKLLMKQVTRSAFEDLMQEKEGSSSPPCRRTKSSRLTEADKLLLKQATRSAFQELMEEEEGVFAQPVTAEQEQTNGIQPQELTKMERILTADSYRIAQSVRPSSVCYEKIEELIYDIPDPDLPMPEPTMEIQEFTLPPWSPGLPESSQYVEELYIDNVPDEILYYESPKEQETRSPKKSTPKQTPPTTQHQRSLKPVARNLFDEFQETELLEDENLTDEQLVRSPCSPRTPPTPPRIEEYYNVEASPERVQRHEQTSEQSQSPRQLQTQKMLPCRADKKSPENLTEKLRQHKYTDQRYDLRRDLITKSVQIKNKRVPIRKSRPPGVCTIVETMEEGSNLPPRGALHKHEITEAKPIPSRFPEYIPKTLDFDSPTRGEEIDAFTQLQPQHTVGICDVSPPKITEYPEEIVEYEEVVEFPDFPDVEHIPQEFVYSPPRQEYYGRSMPAKQNPLRPGYASPNALHDSRSVLRKCPGSPARSAQPHSYALPMADYYGSPGRVHVRTPTWNRQRTSPRAAESVTVTEFREPFDEFTSRCNPKVLGTCSIEAVDDDVASGFQ